MDKDIDKKDELTDEILKDVNGGTSYKQRKTPGVYKSTDAKEDSIQGGGLGNREH